MGGINLYHYVFSQSFSHSVAKFDIIVTDLKQPVWKGAKQIIDLESFGYDVSLGSSLAKRILGYKRVLFVITELLASHFVQLLEFLKQNGVICIFLNCGVGVDSVICKDNFDIKDISEFVGKTPVYEPVSKEQFDTFLDSDSSVYIRLCDQFVLERHSAYMTKNDQYMLDMRKLDFFGSQMTIVLGGQYLSYAATLHESLQGDVFACSRYDLGFGSNVLDSVKQTGRLVVVVDHDFGSFQGFLEDKLGSLFSRISVSLVCPNYGSIQTNMKEYLHTMGDFDPEIIVDRVLG